jgi:hypothetical protein
MGVVLVSLTQKGPKFISLTMELDLGMASGISILLFPMCFIKFPSGSQIVPPSHSEKHFKFYPILFGHISTSIVYEV